MRTNKTRNTSEAVEPRDFSSFLLEQSRGATHAELSEGLHDLVGRVQDTGKKGSLTLIITVEPMKGDDGAVIIGDEIRLKLPEHDRPASMYFIGSDGNVMRDDPRQASIFDDLRAAPAPPALNAPRGVDSVTGEASDDYRED